MDVPSPEELAVVRKAVKEVVGDDKIAKFKDADLALLWSGRFETKEDLLAATSEQLAFIKLPAALIAHLQAVQGECIDFLICTSNVCQQRRLVIGKKLHWSAEQGPLCCPLAF